MGEKKKRVVRFQQINSNYIFKPILERGAKVTQASILERKTKSKQKEKTGGKKGAAFD